MICTDCREAGNTPKINEYYLAVVKTRHERCKGGTFCDCQHVAGPVTDAQ